jgi:hypothetical protein
MSTVAFSRVELLFLVEAIKAYDLETSENPILHQLFVDLESRIDEAMETSCDE